MPQTNTRRDPAERFWAQVDTSQECWVWQGCRDRDGYGRFYSHTEGGKKRRMHAHRFAYEQCRGAIPAGLVLDHLCRNRACCNPAHLEIVSHRVNNLRGESFAARNARETHCPQGHPYDGDNVIRTKRRDRRCRTCARLEQAVIRACLTPEEREQRSAYQRAYRQAHQEHLRAYNRVYRQKRQGSDPAKSAPQNHDAA
jgi:hypothetical protein